MAEFGDDLVTYLNPLDSGQLAKLMEEKIANSKNEEINLQKLQSQYSWKIAALKTWEVLNHFIN